MTDGIGIDVGLGIGGDEVVLVTGGSGFIASHCIAQLLEQGYRVRTTVRSRSREADVRATLRRGGHDPGERLEFAEADLTEDAGWADAVANVKYVLHVASPFPVDLPKDENELIVPAREGALRVLRAARGAGAQRVVLTSSFAAIGYGTVAPGHVFTEEDWTDPDEPGIGAYVKSKTLAERAAWDYVQGQGAGLELAVVNPVGVLGPVWSSDYSTSIQLVSRLLDGSVPGIPRLTFNLVDVRDVADLHVLAMLSPAAVGERFLAVGGEPVSMAEIAGLLKQRLGEQAKKVPTRVLPNWLVRTVSMFDSSLKQIVPELGHVRPASSEKARATLDWKPRSNEEAILGTANSLIAQGLVKA